MIRRRLNYIVIKAWERGKGYGGTGDRKRERERGCRRKNKGWSQRGGEIVEIQRKDRMKNEEVRNRKVSLRSKTNAQ